MTADLKICDQDSSFSGNIFDWKPHKTYKYLGLKYFFGSNISNIPTNLTSNPTKFLHCTTLDCNILLITAILWLQNSNELVILIHNHRISISFNFNVIFGNFWLTVLMSPEKTKHMSTVVKWRKTWNLSQIHRPTPLRQPGVRLPTREQVPAQPLRTIHAQQPHPQPRNQEQPLG